MKLRGRALRVSIPIAFLCLLLAASAFAAAGGLTQKPGTAGCISDDGTSGLCVDGSALNNAQSVVISPDGANAYVASYGSGAVTIFDRNTTTGALTQKPGTAGCISYNGSAGDCVDGTGIGGPLGVTISPDGANVYVAANDDNAVAIFDRNATTGALTEKPGIAGCISETGAGPCTDGTALTAAQSVTISPDGRNAYVTSQNSKAVAIFDRDATTGALTQKPGIAGCISSDIALTACTTGTALDGANSVSISPDGKNAYITARYSSAVTIFDRDTTTGTLVQKPTTAGCISDTGAGSCFDGAALDFTSSVTVSADGANAYVASYNGGAAIFDRNPTTGTLTQKPTTAGCISDDGSSGTCSDGTALTGLHSIAVSPDGSSVYFAAQNSAALAIFDRNAGTGALTQKPGTAGCISESGTSGSCVDGTALAGAGSVAVSPDGANAYLAAGTGNALAIFDRDMPPETTIDTGPGGPTNDSTPTFTFSSGDPGSGFECKVDTGSFAPCSGPGGSETLVALADGPHSFAVRAIDPASTPDATPATRDFTVDTEAPVTKITKKPKSKLKTSKSKVKAKVSFTAEAGSTFTCSLDKAKPKPCASPFSVKAKAKGGKGKKHAISVRATDAAGNADTSPARASFRAIRK